VKDFKDHFSKRSDLYKRFRPTYPPELFAYLSSLAEAHDLAWDCGTGNGQSALKLAEDFTKVFATDPSAEQIKNATEHERVTYKIEKAEQCSLPEDTADLVTVSQAIHWFDFDEFYAEARRVLKPKGIIAVWAYGLPVISAEIDKVILHFHDDVVGEFWQRENRLIEDEYSTIPFPFEQIQTPAFEMCKKWAREDMIGWVSSWSAVEGFLQKNGYDPLGMLEKDLANVWADTEQKEVIFKLILKVGKIRNEH
jgi:ubiquinone/menaquinone biosynthesis C-methylase UbiE